METLSYKESPPEEHGFEYKSSLTLFGLPFLHVSFKLRGRCRPVVARGIIAIGQFSCGFLAIGQFAAGALAFGQFAVGVVSGAQFALGFLIYAVFGLYVQEGHGPAVRSFAWLFHR